LELRRWKAFLRLNGQTMDSEEDILNEFSGFVSALSRIGIEYSIIVNVEGGRTKRFSRQTGPLDPIAHRAQPCRRAEQRLGR
jgi:hypothetical protein